ncbi:hypothetical protein F5141DRAFT_1222764 [Pisolithus sp. B1]|nr:hypothetical protein F5141DRAFT_1222764 [Pisolithus sp. B1]
MDKDQGYPMFDMPGGFRAYYDSSSSIESSSSSLHTTRGLEDIQMIPESTLFDDDGSQMDAVSMRPMLDDAADRAGDVRHPVGDYDAAVSMGVVVGNSCSAAGGTTSGALTSIGTAVATEAERNATGGTTNLQPTSSVDKCHHKEEDFSMSLQKQLYYQGEHIRELKTKLRYQGESFQEQQRILQQQYEDLHRTALNSVVKDFQAQKDALGEMETVLQKRETELTSLCAELETHAKERAAHQEQLYNEQRLATQWNHSQLEEFQRRLELELQSQMEKMSTSRAANLEACVQEEVTRLRGSLQAEKEREMAKLEQEVMWLRESLQAEKEREMANFEQQHHCMRKVRTTTPQPNGDPTDCQEGRPTSPSSRPFLSAANPSRPSRPAQFPQTSTPSLNAIKRIRRARGISTRTRLIGVAVDEDVGNEGNGGSPGERQTSPVEGGEPSGGSSNTVPISAMVEVVTRGVEAALHNVLADGKMIPSRSGRRSRRRRVCEDEEVKLEKESEPAVHQDFILAEVRRLFKEKLGITQDLDFITHRPATAEDVRAYEYEDGFGPDRNNLSFDLTQNYSSPWNTYILKLLCQELQARCKEENWPIKRGDNYIMEILRERYKRLRMVWRNAQPKLTSKGVLETPTETEACLVEGRIQMGKDSRQANCRRNKYHRRVMVLDEMVKSKSEAQDDDLQSWKWLRSLIKTLGEHGMSSEESSVENGVENVLRVKNMPWRRNIDRELEIVDFQRLLDTDIFSPQGSKPLTRKHSPDNPSTTRDAVKALPLALYDGAWFAQLTERQIEALNVPQQTFSWMKVVVA